jgi:hypothetical protein
MLLMRTTGALFAVQFAPVPNPDAIASGFVNLQAAGSL